MIIGAGSQFSSNNSHTLFYVRGDSTSNAGTLGSSGNLTASGSPENNVDISSQSTTSAPYRPNGITRAFKFNADNEYYYAADNAAYDFGTQDFTFSGWCKRESVSTGDCPFVVGHFDSNSNTLLAMYFSLNTSLSLYIGATDDWKFAYDSTMVYPGTSSYIGAVTHWIHFAICRQGTKGYHFLMGKLISGSPITNWTTSLSNCPTQGITIGGAGRYIFWFDGYVANCKLEKGICRWNRNFTPPNRAS